MDNELDKYYELLGVAPGTSGQELKDAYRDLAKVWHPDRFSHDPRLQQKAQEKLKEINEAYERLTSGKAARRPRPAPATAETHAPAATRATATNGAATARRKRPLLFIPAAAVFCAAFFVALNSLTPPSARPAPEPTPSGREQAQNPEKNQQPESVAHAAAGQTARGKERAGRESPAEATSGGDAGAGPSAQGLRPMPTVTVTIDAATGMLATRDCPTLGRMTYPAGSEPREYCTAPHKAKRDAQADSPGPKDSRLKSIGKRLAAPFKR